MTLGQRIRALRMQRGWTQRELERQAGVESRNLTRYENDKVRPRLKVLQGIAEALEVSVDELVAEDDSTPEHAFRDKELLNQFLAVEQMEDDDKAAIKRVIQAMILKHKVRGLQTA